MFPRRFPYVNVYLDSVRQPEMAFYLTQRLTIFKKISTDLLFSRKALPGWLNHIETPQMKGLPIKIRSSLLGAFQVCVHLVKT